MPLSQPRWPRVLPTALVVGAATLGPLGRKLPAPGTWGSLAGLLYFLLFLGHAPDIAILAATALLAYLSVGLCGEAEVRLSRKDPGMVVLDEVVAVPLCFLGWRTLTWSWPAWVVLLVGVLWFRVFDIAKPLGIRRLQALPAGWGVVADDVAAALAACVALHASVWVWARI